ncbi:MAG: hypothetical protein ACO2OZ_12200 [Acidilobaceae archaeon]|jgi:hypothetical protein
MLRGFKVAFAAVITALLALYAPLLSLNAYSTTLSEVVYEGFNYRVTYKSPLIPLASSDKTSVVLEVKRNGKPIDFGFTLSGITVDGARDVAKGRGHGRASADITGYVDDIVRVLREANSNPAYSGLGLLTFIVSKVEEDGEEYIATDIISIPVIPGKARGKDIVVEVEFKPAHKIKLNKTSDGEQTGRAEVLQTTSPGTIPDHCKEDYIVYRKCYKWELTKIYYVSSRAASIPLAMSYIDSTDGEYIKIVHHQHWMLLLSQAAPQLSFDLSLVFRKVIDFIVPGPGYIITLPPGVSRLELFYLDCTFTNSYLTSEEYDCYYFNEKVGKWTFYKEALITTGITGRMWLVEYQYVEETCMLVGCFKEVLDSSLAVYMVPHFRLPNKIDYSIHIDEDPNDGIGLMEKIFYFLYYDSYTTRKLYTVTVATKVIIWSSELMAKSGSTPLFGIGIPVGAHIRALAGSIAGWSGTLISTLAAGFSTSSNQFYISLTIMTYYATTHRCFRPHYIELTEFPVKEAGDYYRTPIMVVRPSTRAPSQC